MKFQGFMRAGGTMIAASALSFGVGLAAHAQGTTIPDAQVESNVLRQLATAPELSTQNIQTTTVYGVVTMTGNVHDDAMRSKAENLVSRSLGVKKVVDQMTLGDTPPPSDQAAQGSDPSEGNMAPQDGAPGQVLQSDGTYAPANGGQAPPPDGGNGQMQPPPGGGQAGPPPQDNGQYADQQGPPQQGQYPDQQGPPQQGQYPPDQQGPPQRQPMYGNGYGQAPPPPPGSPYAGQRAGIPVTIPPGVPLQIRLNRGFNSDEVAIGTQFTGVVMYDVVADGQVAIPRGASVSGTVTDAKRAGAFKGKGQLSLQLNTVTLGGQVYPLNSAVWDARGRDKTGHTVGNAVGLGILGAIVGGAAGGGGGAAIGAAVGAGAGVAVSGVQPGGQILLPPESMIGFMTGEPVTVRTVSQQEMARLSYAAGPPPPPRQGYRHRYYSPYYGYYYGPGM